MSLKLHMDLNAWNETSVTAFFLFSNKHEQYLQNSLPTLSGLSVLAEIRLCAFGCQKLNNGHCSPCLLEELHVAQPALQWTMGWWHSATHNLFGLLCVLRSRARSRCQSDRAVLVSTCTQSKQGSIMELNSMLDFRSGRSDML